MKLQSPEPTDPPNPNVENISPPQDKPKKKWIRTTIYIVLIVLILFQVSNLIKKANTPTQEEMLQEAQLNPNEVRFQFGKCSEKLPFEYKGYKGNQTFCQILWTYKGYIIREHNVNLTVVEDMDTYVDCKFEGGCNQRIVPKVPFSPEEKQKKNVALSTNL